MDLAAVFKPLAAIAFNVMPSKSQALGLGSISAVWLILVRQTITMSCHFLS